MSNIEGLDSLLKKFDSLSNEGFKTLVKSVKREGQVVKGNAKLLCPVDTGELRGSIQEKTEISDEEKEEFIYTRGQPAQPFMYPALKDYEKYATRNIKEDMSRFLKKVCR